MYDTIKIKYRYKNVISDVVVRKICNKSRLVLDHCQFNKYTVYINKK